MRGCNLNFALFYFTFSLFKTFLCGQILLQVVLLCALFCHKILYRKVIKEQKGHFLDRFMILFKNKKGNIVLFARKLVFHKLYLQIKFALNLYTLKAKLK